MRLLFCLYKYFPYGGLQRDFKNIAIESLKRGHDINVFTTKWIGDVPEGFKLELIKVKGLTNHGRSLSFSNRLVKFTESNKFDMIIGFNKMSCLDVYYAADPCYKSKAIEGRGYFYKFSNRYRTYVYLENEVFSPKSRTHILLLSKREKENFIKYYNTPENRFHLLPPGISKDRYVLKNREDIRSGIRNELNIKEDDHLLLMIGSGFKTKGVDRAIRAISSLSKPVRNKTKLVIIGDGRKKKFEELAKELNVDENVRFLGGREDIHRFLVGADLLIHPAYSENTGTVLIEAIVNGLPVLASDVCGYASYVEDSNSGLLIPSPFKQEVFNGLLEYMLTSIKYNDWKQSGLEYGKKHDFFSMYTKAVDIIEDLARVKVK